MKRRECDVFMFPSFFTYLLSVSISVSLYALCILYLLIVFFAMHYYVRYVAVKAVTDFVYYEHGYIFVI